MHFNNPYALAGWANSANPMSINNTTWHPDSPPQPSIYGALPSPSVPDTPHYLSFYFTSFNPTVLNCEILGPKSQLYLRAVTNHSSSPERTVIQNHLGLAIAIVEWERHPTVEMNNVLTRQTIPSFLRLSADGRYRYMKVNGVSYIWLISESPLRLCTLGSGPSPPELLARFKPGHGVNTLEISTQAIQQGLLEVSILAIVIMQSGRKID